MEKHTEDPINTLYFWIPAIITGIVTCLVFLVVGHTPLIRALGLALVIVGATATMRRMGAVVSIGGGLTLAFCGIFWSQTGGGDAGPATIIIAIIAAVLASILILAVSHRPYIGIGLGIACFVGLFWSQIGTPKSLRLTGFVTAWLMYLIVDMILMTNPRPEAKPPQAPKPFHIVGILFLFSIGVLNDSLLALLGPAILLSLFLSYAALPRWYWLLVIVAILLGLFSLADTYIVTDVPLINLMAWRDANRWIELVELIISQFSIVGVALGVIGIARLSRWYPALGTTTMIAYAAYVFFGLVYEGNFRNVLLLPLLIIHVLWISYAVNALGQWVNKTLGSSNHVWTHLVSASYLVLPAILLWNIIQSL